MDELHEAHKKLAGLESRMKSLESKLAEKEAMIRALQQHSLDKDKALQNSVFAQRNHNPVRHGHSRSASTMGLTSNNIVIKNSTRDELKEMDRESSESESTSGSNGFETTKKNLDEQLKELDSRISNKDSIIRALRNEKEKNPHHYNNWRL